MVQLFHLNGPHMNEERLVESFTTSSRIRLSEVSNVEGVIRSNYEHLNSSLWDNVSTELENHVGVVSAHDSNPNVSISVTQSAQI